MHYHLHSLHSFGYTPCNPLIYLVSDAGTVKDSKSRYNLLVRRQECVLLPSLLLFLSIIFVLLYRILRYSYSISLYLELAREHSIQHSILGHSALSLYNRSRLPLFDTLLQTSFYDCLATASLPFSLTRQEHPTKTNTSRILLFDTRRVGTSKRSNLEA